MSDISYFESRSGNLKCSANEVYNFVIDIRNFEQFVPQGVIDNWQADREACSFSVSMLGPVAFRLIEKEMYTRVLFVGDAMKIEDFSLLLYITNNGQNPASIKISLKIDLNPMFRMIAEKPINQFLESLISKMENFNGWKEIKE
jgi:ribosome-associated toxin RatA of RatAB toxin-antitoxin module